MTIDEWRKEKERQRKTLMHKKIEVEKKLAVVESQLEDPERSFKVYNNRKKWATNTGKNFPPAAGPSAPASKKTTVLDDIV